MIEFNDVNTNFILNYTTSDNYTSICNNCDDNTIDENKIINDQKEKDKDKNNVNKTIAEIKEIYILKYKEKIGIQEKEEIYVFDENNNPRRNLQLKITSVNGSDTILTDENGKVIYIPKNIGKYEIYAPYPNEEIKGEFEVLDNYISSDSDYIELKSSDTSSTSNTKSNGLAVGIVISMVVLIIAGVILYFILRPKKKDFYNFETTDFYKLSEYHQKVNEVKTEVKVAEAEKNIISNKISYRYKN